MRLVERFSALAGALIVGVGGAAVSAQSTTATVSGIVRDEQKAVVAGAVVTSHSLDTGQVQSVRTNAAGRYLLLALPPGPYAVTVGHPGFRAHVREPITLTINQHLTLDAVLRVAAEQNVEVVAPAPELPATVLGRTITSHEIDQLPVTAREFSTLAQLTPGILMNRSGLAVSAANPGIAASGQFSRNNRFLIDGLLYDRFNTGTPRGSYPVDAVQEFAVMSNGFGAEYGQAAGAVVAVVTRSGSNTLAGRAFYFHRDDALDATPGAARLAGESKARLEQFTGGAAIGGPLRRNRAFYFAAMEAVRTNNDWIVSSPTLALFRPADPPVFPNPRYAIDLFGRADVQHRPSHRITVRAHGGKQHVPHLSTETPRTRVSRERTTDSSQSGVEPGVVHSWIDGDRLMNETRMQYATLNQDLRALYCDRCPTEDRPSLLLGSASNPQSIDERFWQFGDTLTFVPSRWGGKHILKAGGDLILARNDNEALINPFGTFRFETDLPFDAADPLTYPTRFEQRTGPAVSRLTSRVYAAFVQDEWKLSRATLNLGVRWDHVDSLGISRKANNVAPRLGASAPFAGGVLRASAGRYYDSVYVQVTRNEAIAPRQQTLRVDQPFRYVPWTPGTPFVNPLHEPGIAGVVQRDTSAVVTKDIPYTDQGTVGIHRQIGRSVALTVDAVHSRGRNLLMTRDQNYPLNVGVPGARIRPNTAVGRVTAVESIGNSWYSALLIGLNRRYQGAHAYAIAYTWSSAERDTEQGNYMPVDHRRPQDERGPSSSDVRHRFVASGHASLRGGIRLAGILTAESAAPYNVTLGVDANFDTFPNDRPAGMGRNSRRGDDLWQFDMRVSKVFAWRSRSVEVMAEAFNLLNHRNWSGFNGAMTATTFGRPQNAEPPRQIQLGVRVDVNSR